MLVEVTVANAVMVFLLWVIGSDHSLPSKSTSSELVVFLNRVKKTGFYLGLG